MLKWPLTGQYRLSENWLSSTCPSNRFQIHTLLATNSVWPVASWWRESLGPATVTASLTTKVDIWPRKRWRRTSLSWSWGAETSLALWATMPQLPSRNKLPWTRTRPTTRRYSRSSTTETAPSIWRVPHSPTMRMMWPTRPRQEVSWLPAPSKCTWSSEVWSIIMKKL